MMILTENGWRRFYNPATPEASPGVIRLTREAVHSRNAFITEYNRTVESAQRFGRMMEYTPQALVAMPDWAQR